jgi:hypothetical protein
MRFVITKGLGNYAQELDAVKVQVKAKLRVEV